MKRIYFLLLASLLSFTSAAQAHFPNQTPEADYAESRSLYDRALYSSASEGFQSILRRVDKQTDLAEQSHCYKVLCAIKLMNRDSDEQVHGFLQSYPTSARRVELLIEMSEYAFNRRRYKDAKKWLKQLDGVRLPKSQRAAVQFKLGYSYFLLKEYDQARPQLAAVKASDYPDAKSAQYYYGHIAYLDSNDVTALACFEPLRSHQQFGAVVPYYLAQIYARNGMDNELLGLGEQLLSKATTRRAPEIAKLIGQSLYRKSRYVESLPYLELHKAQGGKLFASDQYILGVVYYRTERYVEAMQSLNKITGANNAMAQNAYYLLADCYIRAEQPQEALTAFKAASQSDHDKVIQEESAYQAAKLTYQSASPFGNAIKAFQDFLKDYPKTEYRREVNEYLANLYISSKDYSKAMESILQTGMASMAMMEAYQRVAYYRAVEYYHVSDWHNAVEYFQKSLAYPKNITYVALSHFWMGELSYRKGNHQEALSRFESFLNTPGSYTLTERPDALYNKAYCLYQLGQHEDAAAAFRVYLADAPKASRKKEDATLRVADLYFLLRRHAVAQQFYQKASALHGVDVAYAEYQRAMCLGLLNDQSGKIAVLKQLETRGGSYAEDALFERAETHLREGENLAAEQAFKAFARLKPNSQRGRRALLNVSLAQRNAGQLEQSIQGLRTFVVTYPGTAEADDAVLAAKMVYDELDQIDNYLEWVQGLAFVHVRASELDSVAYMSAYSKYASANYDEASKAFGRYLKRYPDGFFAIEAHYLKGESHRVEGSYPSSLENYQWVANDASPGNSRRLSAWTWVLKLANELERMPVAMAAAEHVLAQSESEEAVRLANVTLMVGYWDNANATQENQSYDLAYSYAEVVHANDRNEPQDRDYATLVMARSAMHEWRNNPNDPIAGDRARRANIVLAALASPAAQAEAAFQEAVFLREMDLDYQQSNTKVFWLIDNLPGQAEWRYKSLLVLAKNYADLNDLFQANYTLDFLIDEQYSDEIVTQAVAIKAALKAQEAAESSRTDTLINLNEPQA